MLYQTKGIVFSTIKFKETSIIARIFTKSFGMQSYIVNGVRSQRSKGKTALYQPLSLLDMVVYNKEGKDIQRISEAKFAYTFSEIPFDPTKRTIGIFLTEIFGKVLREESENSDLFDFLYHSLELFDHLKEGVSNFHLQILLKATHLLGFGPEKADSLIHQLSESGFHFSTLEGEKELIDQLINANYGGSLNMSNTFRRELLDHIIKFYKIHSGNLKEIKSLNILKVILTT